MAFKNKIYGILSAFWSLFIFSNSLKEGERSAEMSGSIVSWIVNLLTKWGLSAEMDMLTVFVRKAAHFTEFLILGVLLALCFSYCKQAVSNYVFRVLFLSLFAGNLDELIQSFIPGRSSDVRDVMIDFAGAATGLLILVAVNQIKKKRKRQ